MPGAEGSVEQLRREEDSMSGNQQATQGQQIRHSIPPSRGNLPQLAYTPQKVREPGLEGIVASESRLVQ